uniref:BTB domain-containing protein n=1 Tax=Setaria digitata TaxID=48799 RepID=A0A915PZL2_9BILA
MISVAGITMDSRPQAQTSTSNIERPFRLLVKDRLFIIESTIIAKLSPIFARMMVCPESNSSSTAVNDDHPLREIVDESSGDIATFLNCCSDANLIDENNFATVLRLSKKYQVSLLIDACEEFITNKCDLDTLKADQVVSLLIVSNEYHLRKEVMVKLIRRIASETKNDLARLKLSRLLSPQLHGSIVATNLNMIQLREVESMNGHLFKMNRSVTLYRRMACEMCKRITDSAYCEGCKKAFCKDHWTHNKCTSDYGQHMLDELRTNLVELEYE